MRRFLVAAGILACTAVDAGAQRTIELVGGAGYTAVDLEAFYQGEVNDWGQAWYGGHLLVVPLDFGAVGVGAEVGWQYLAWFDYNSLGTTITRELSALSVMAAVRVPLSDIFFSELTAGVFMFDEFTDPAVGAALGGRIPMSAGWSIPVKVRTSIVMDEHTNFVPIALELGLGRTW